MKKIFLILYVLYNHTNFAGLGYMVAQKAAQAEQAKNIIYGQATRSSASSTSGNGTGSGNQQCPVCNDDSTAAALPNFAISFYNTTTATKPVHSLQFSPNNFTVSNALLYVDIFPPSNTISQSGVTISTTDPSYAIVYTLKTPSGSMMQKMIEYGQNSQGNPISMTAIPTIIAVGVTGQNQNAQVQNIGQNFFLPTLASHSATTQQRIFNNICPLSQIFWINVNSSGITAIPIESTLNTTTMLTDSNQSTQPNTLSNPFGSLNNTSGTAINQIQITLTDSGNNSAPFTFGGSSSAFYNQDLQNGLIAHIHIFPPSYPNAVNNAYIVIVTLQTIDGLKFHKKVLNPAPFTGIPCFLQISQNGKTIFSSNITNINNTQQTINYITPLRIRCIINSTAVNMV